MIAKQRLFSTPSRNPATPPPSLSGKPFGICAPCATWAVWLAPPLFSMAEIINCFPLIQKFGRIRSPPTANASALGNWTNARPRTAGQSIKSEPRSRPPPFPPSGRIPTPKNPALVGAISFPPSLFPSKLLSPVRPLNADATPASRPRHLEISRQSPCPKCRNSAAVPSAKTPLNHAPLPACFARPAPVPPLAPSPPEKVPLRVAGNFFSEADSSQSILGFSFRPNRRRPFPSPLLAIFPHHPNSPNWTGALQFHPPAKLHCECKHQTFATIPFAPVLSFPGQIRDGKQFAPILLVAFAPIPKMSASARLWPRLGRRSKRRPAPKLAARLQWNFGFFRIAFPFLHRCAWRQE